MNNGQGGVVEASARIDVDEALPEGLTFEPLVDREAQEFQSEVAAGMPEGEALGMAEARMDYLLERIATEHERIARIQAAASARIAMIRDHADDECAKLVKRVSYLEGVIRQNLPGDADHFRRLYGKKSLSLPNGKVGYRVVAPTVEIEDQARAIAWAEQAGVPVTEKVTRTLGKKAVLEYIAQRGELPDTDAIEYVDGYERFYVQAGGEA